MHDLGRHEEDLDPEEAYDRYREWLPFTHRNKAFYQALAKDSAMSSKAVPES